jgi:hypothetical protein
MMLPTHALVGVAIATPLLVLAPEHATVALVGGLVGGILPDLDLYAGHRRTLHYPSVYPLAAIPAVAGALLLGTPFLVGVSFLLLAAALHCQMDRYGGGLELRPWEGRSNRAVYDHARGRWLRPKRWVRYDGAPEDLLLMAGLALPLLYVLEAPFQPVVAVALIAGVGYGLLRRRLAALAPAVVARVPEPVVEHVPERYRG